MPFVSAFYLIDEVARADRASWEATMTAEYGGPIEVLVFADDDVVMPLAPQYFPVAAVVGPSAGVLVPGRNLLDSAPRAAAILAALAHGDVAVSDEVSLLRNGHAAFVAYMPVRWPNGNRTSLIGLTIEDAVAFEVAVGDVADTTMHLSVAQVKPNGSVAILYQGAGSLGVIAGLQPYVTTFGFGGNALRVLLGPSVASVDAVKTARLTSTLSWGAPVVAAVGVGSLVLMTLRLLAQVSATREALASSEQTRDSIMAFFFHELRNPLHAAMGLLRALREDAGGPDVAAVPAAEHKEAVTALPTITFSPSTRSCGVSGSTSTDTTAGLGEVERQLLRISGVMDSLLDVTRKGEVPIMAAEVDLPALLRDVAQVRRRASPVSCGASPS
jgi:signal transduction histidine kinase